MATPKTASTGNVPGEDKMEKLLGSNNPITQAALDKAVEDLTKALNRIGKPVWIAVSVVILALLIGFCSILMIAYQIVIDSNRTKSDGYIEMLKASEQSNTQVLILTNEIKDLKDFMQNCNAWRTSSC